MAILDRNMFRQTSAVSPGVTVIGESGGGVRPEIDIPPPSAEITIPSFEQPEFEVNPIIDDIPTETPNLTTDFGLEENQIKLSTGEIITLDPTYLSNIVNSNSFFNLDIYGMLNSPDVLLGSNVERIVGEALENRGGSGTLFRSPMVPYRMAKDMFAEGGEELMNLYRRLGYMAQNNPDFVAIYNPEKAKELRKKIARNKIDPFEKIDDFYVSPIADEDKNLGEALQSGFRSKESLDDLYRGAQLQSEIDDLDVPSQTQMESDVAEELPTEEIAANTIETQDSVDELPSDIDTQADLERRIKEGQAQAALDKVDRSTLTKKEREDRIKEDLDDTTFELTQEQRNQFLADEDKYIKDLAIADTFGGQKLKDFLGSMGKRLVTTASFMGIPLGTADFVESEEGKRATEAKLEGEFAIEQLKQTGEDTSGIELKATNYLALTKNIKENVPFLEGNIQSVKLLEKAIDIVNNSPNATGGLGLFQSYLSDIQSFFGKDTKNFENLPAYKQVGIIIESIRQKNLQAVLGESGRTISDRDRDIITRVFGDQRRGMASKAEILQLLTASLNGFKSSGKQYKDQIVTDIELLNADPRYTKQVQVYNSPEYQRYSLDYETLTETLINTKKLLDIDIIDIDL